ncbi:DNA-processing protein DprA [Sporofaciens musculi]|uniref:DNA-processing protein DprA n=1 Tax=Sporofaciens musculi TaxID=2681861 RepID=UPI00256FEDA5|nr:DNA-processing protein DprA [Sporofaciens musculi]
MKYEYWLAAISCLSDSKKRLLREEYKEGRAVYYIEEMQLRRLPFLKDKEVEGILAAKKEIKLQREWEGLIEKNIRFVPYFSEEYPKKLSQIGDGPYALYVKGKLPKEGSLSVAIVGARKCTPYGEEMALDYGKYLAEHGVQVISGMARGVDGAGHRGALNGGGVTFGVLGCGVDICYPRENIGLYMDIQKRGGVISEQLPAKPPLPMYFPMRNRIISGLSDVVLVMEAREKSGSLITADQALEQGKDVYALPGPATSRLSLGCHFLIRQGAGILISPKDLLTELGIAGKELEQKSDKIEKMLENDENVVYSCLGFFPKGISQLIEETGLSAPVLMQELISLELKGCIREVSKNYYIRVR